MMQDIEIDDDADAAYVRIAEGSVVRTQEVAEGVLSISMPMSKSPALKFLAWENVSERATGCPI
jgi:hypothetical protein